MDFLKKVRNKFDIIASGDVLIAWEFDPDAFHHALRPALAAFKRERIPYDLAHDRADGSPYRMREQGFNLGKVKGNDWSHVSVGMLKNYEEKDDLETITALAKANVPTWKVKSYGILPTTVGLSYLVLDLDYPKEAGEFETGMRKYGGERFSTPTDKGFKHRPHASLLGFEASHNETVNSLMKSLPISSRSIETKAIQIWKGFHVIEHIML